MNERRTKYIEVVPNSGNSVKLAISKKFSHPEIGPAIWTLINILLLEIKDKNRHFRNKTQQYHD